MNDINAACAATQHVISVPTVSVPAANIEERLMKLQDLKKKGLIDDTDYIKRKNELLSQI